MLKASLKAIYNIAAVRTLPTFGVNHVLGLVLNVIVWLTPARCKNQYMVNWDSPTSTCMALTLYPHQL